jgi:hypothetical protein
MRRVPKGRHNGHLEHQQPLPFAAIERGRQAPRLAENPGGFPRADTQCPHTIGITPADRER